MKMAVFLVVVIALMMEAASTSETSANFQHITRRNNSEDSHLQVNNCSFFSYHNSTYHICSYSCVRRNLTSFVLPVKTETRLDLLSFTHRFIRYGLYLAILNVGLHEEKRHHIATRFHCDQVEQKEDEEGSVSFIGRHHTDVNQTQTQDKDHIERSDRYRLATSGYLMGLELMVQNNITG
jgi:hypothetical protein